MVPAWSDMEQAGSVRYRELPLPSRKRTAARERIASSCKRTAAEGGLIPSCKRTAARGWVAAFILASGPRRERGSFFVSGSGASAGIVSSIVAAARSSTPGNCRLHPRASQSAGSPDTPALTSVSGGRQGRRPARLTQERAPPGRHRFPKVIASSDECITEAGTAVQRPRGSTSRRPGRGWLRLPPARLSRPWSMTGEAARELAH